MEQKKTFLGEFTFTNTFIQCESETIIDKFSGQKVERIVMRSVNGSNIEMGYSMGDGLKVINTSKRKNNPLGEFLGIQINEISDIKNFISKYGYLYHIPSNDFVNMNYLEFVELQNRLRLFITLINNQNDFQFDRKELTDAVVSIILTKYDKYELSQSELLPYNEDLLKLLHSSITVSKDHNTVINRVIDGQTMLFFSRYSTILEEAIEISFEDMNRCTDSSILENVLRYLFFNLDNLEIPENLKQKIEFLMVYYTTDFFTSDLSEDGKVKSKLLDISKILIVEEFEFYLKSISFTYNTETMTPDWKLPNLLAAMYFSIYYRNSKNVIYRKCENINCNQYFEVSSTNSVKKHCCDNCRDNKNARKSRARKKEEREG